MATTRRKATKKATKKAPRKKVAKKTLRHRVYPRRMSKEEKEKYINLERSIIWRRFLEAAMEAGEPVVVAERKADAALRAFEQRFGDVLG